MKKTEYNHVAITGMGVVSPYGVGLDLFESGLKNTRCAIQRSNRYTTLNFDVVSADLADFNFSDAFSAYENKTEHLKLGSRAPLTIQAAMIAALEALNDLEQCYDIRRTGLVVAGEHINNNYTYQQTIKWQDQMEYVRASYALNCLDTGILGVLSELLNIQGEGVCVGGASASGHVGLLYGKRMLEQGHMDRCIIVGALADISPVLLQSFYQMGAYGGRNFCKNPELACRPFDRLHEGFLYGQGCACIVLETLANLKQTKTKPLAILKSIVECIDGKATAAPRKEGEEQAMMNALQQAELKPEDIHYINTHGTSSPLGDSVEIKALRTVFKTHLNDCKVNATKGLIGHCLWSAGLMEIIATILQLNGSYVHGNRNLIEPIDSSCGFVGPEQEKVSGLKYALCNSFGFNGINSSAVIMRGDDI